MNKYSLSIRAAYSSLILGLFSLVLSFLLCPSESCSNADEVIVLSFLLGLLAIFGLVVAAITALLTALPGTNRFVPLVLFGLGIFLFVLKVVDSSIACESAHYTLGSGGCANPPVRVHVYGWLSLFAFLGGISWLFLSKFWKTKFLAPIITGLTGLTILLVSIGIHDDCKHRIRPLSMIYEPEPCVQEQLGSIGIVLGIALLLTSAPTAFFIARSGK